MTSTQVKMLFMVPCALFRFCSKWNYEKNRPAVVKPNEKLKDVGTNRLFDQHSLPLSVHIFQRSPDGFVLTWTTSPVTNNYRSVAHVNIRCTWTIFFIFYYAVSCFCFFFLRSSWACSTFVGGGFITLQVGLKNTHALVEGFSFLFIGHWLISVYCWPNDFI